MTIRELLAEESPTLRRRLASLFSGLPDETPASPLSCAAGEVVVRQDAPCRCVYVLVEGRPTPPGSSPEAPPTPTSSSAPSPSSGVRGLCGANCFLAEVRARTACRFWVLAREDYFSWFFSGRDTTLSRVREVVRSLWEQARRERGYLSLDSDSRLLSFLVSWYEANAGGGTACIPMTRPAIGDETGCAPARSTAGCAPSGSGDSSTSRAENSAQPSPIPPAPRGAGAAPADGRAIH
ncbi:MAG: Crp/Fnr family transcriptional regulator [Flavonifractor plautii]